MNAVRVLLAAIALCVGLSCGSGNGDLLAGGTTETGNAVAGLIVDGSGTPRPSAVVRLLPVNHNPVLGPFDGDTLVATTDAQGKFRIPSVPVDSFTLSATDPITGERAYSYGIGVPGGRDPVNVGTVSLSPSRPLTLQFTEQTHVAGAAMYVPGTLRWVRLDSLGLTASLDSLAGDTAPVVYFDTGRGREIARSAGVAVGDTCGVDRVCYSLGTSIACGTVIRCR